MTNVPFAILRPKPGRYTANMLIVFLNRLQDIQNQVNPFLKRRFVLLQEAGKNAN
jgi:hypothetical protein